MSEKHSDSRRPDFRKALKTVWGWLSRNLAFKILALILAAGLWAGLILQDPTLTREKTFNDVSVTISGEDTMKRNGFIVVSDMRKALSKVTIHAEVPQLQYTAASASAYNARVDLSRIRETGEQSVRVATTNTSTYGTVTEVSPSSITVEVEEYVSRYRIPVTLITTGSAPEGYYATAASADPARVTVSGPKSLADRVVRAEAELDLSSLPGREGSVRTAVGFRLVDAAGETVTSKLLQVTSESVLLDSVIAEQSLYPTRSIALSDVGLVSGEPADGYEIKSVTITPQTVTGAGKSEGLDAIDALFADSSIDISNATESVTGQLRLRRPSELTWLSTDAVTVAVDIAPIVSERTFTDVKITLTGVASSLRGKMDASQADVKLIGEVLALAKARSNQITLYCDASGLEAGTYDLKILCTAPGFETQVIPETMRVTLTEK